jgi:F-type H+-transporting ATPase subunit delta
MAISLVIERYSKTLFQFAKQSESMSSFYTEVQSLGHAVQSNQSISQYIQNPTIASMSKFDFLNTHLQSKLSKSVVEFIKLIAQKNRIHLLKDICESFVVHYKLEVLKIKEVIVKSTTELDSNQIQNLKAKLDGIDGFKYEIKNVLDTSIIGGILIIIGNKVIDNSVAGQLQILKKKLLA